MNKDKNKTKVALEEKAEPAKVMRRCDRDGCKHNVKFFGGKGFCLEGERFEKKPEDCKFDDEEWERRFAEPYRNLPIIS